MNELLKKLNSKNISIGLKEDQLDINAPKGSMTKELLTEIKENKDALMSFLAEFNSDNEIDNVILKATNKSSYALSSSQFRLWFVEQAGKTSGTYNMPSIFSLKGAINAGDLEKAFIQLIERHEILRTNIGVDEETVTPMQVITPVESINFKLNNVDISNEEDVSLALQNISKKEVGYNFNLETDELLRVSLVKKSENDYVMILVMHHIISDGWSSSIMISDLFSLYQSITKNEDSVLEPLSIQYKDYAEWQQSNLEGNTKESHKNYWLNKYKETASTLEIPSARTRPALKTYNGQSIERRFDSKLSEDFVNLCKSKGATTFMGLLAVLDVLLYKYTNQTDIVIGSPFAGRDHAELQNQLGFYVNTVGLRNTFNKEESFETLLNQVKKTTLDAYEYQNFPFDELIKKLNLKVDRSRNALFDVMLTFASQDKSLSNISGTEGLVIEEIPLSDTTSKFDFEFSFKEDKDGLSLRLIYNTDIYDDFFVEKMFGHYEILMDKVIEDSSTSVSALDYMTGAELEEVLFTFNNTSVDYPKDKTIVDLFEDQAKKTPNNIAVVFGDTQLTYKDLNEQSNKLAQFLREDYEIQSDDLIGVKLDRNDQLLVAILAVLKSGAAYVPIDTKYPQERIEYIEDDSNCKEVIDTKMLIKFNSSNEAYSVANHKKINTPNDLAYVIYTSGTTGKPKGVMIQHSNAVAMLNWANNEFDSDKFDVAYALTSHCFDLSVYEMFYPLTIGKTVKVLHNAISALDEIKLDEKVLINTVPSSIRSLMDAGLDLDKVTTINLAGEAFPVDLAKKLLKSNVDVRNLYGPSEDTTYSTTYKLSSDGDYTTSIPIGKPLTNSQTYILDDNLRPLPIGVTGKLYVSGDGVTRGYLNKPELTAERFVPNPFINGAVMYDTGDLAKWMPDGNIEFLGRKDGQVKIRGYRIELEEIENSITEFSDDIQQVVLNVRQSGTEKELVAYYVSKTEIENIKLKRFLQKKIPSYMVPNHYVALEAIPLTPNGKIDKKALPDITSETRLKREYVAPKSELEKELVDLWQEVLGIDKIGTLDNFFEMGGHSLNIVRILNTIRLKMKKEISYDMFYRTLTIQLLAVELEKAAILVDDYRIEKTPLPGPYYPISKAQYRLWVTSRLGGNKALNVPLILDADENFNPEIWRKSLEFLALRHDSLRTCFRENEEKVLCQYIHPKDDFKFEFRYEEGLTPEQIKSKFNDVINHDFDVENGPLFFGGAYKNTSDKYVAWFIMHHLVTDGWSGQVVTKELAIQYNNLQKFGKSVELPEPSIQYQDYSYFMETRDQEKVNKEKEFWNSVFSTKAPLLKLPFENEKRPLKKTYNGGAIITPISEEVLLGLKRECNKLQISLFGYMMGIFKIQLYKYSGESDITLGTPVAGRFNAQLEDQVGLYLNTVPIRTKFHENDKIKDVVVAESKRLSDSIENQMYSMDNLVTDLNIETPQGRSPLFDLMMIYQNQATLDIFEEIEPEVGDTFVEPWTDVAYTQSQFDIVISLFEAKDEDGKNVCWVFYSYNSNIYAEEIVRQVIDDYVFILEDTLSKGDIAVKDYLDNSDHEFISDKLTEPVSYDVQDDTQDGIKANLVAIDEEDLELKGLLKRIVNNSLQVKITNEQDYFTSGGSSLGAIQVINDINAELKSDLTIVDFYNFPSVNNLHDFILQPKSDSEDVNAETKTPIIRFQNNLVDAPTMIFFPPIIGEGLIFKALADTLKDQYNSYGVSIPILKDTENNFEGLSTIIARDIMGLINKDQPLVLVGYSLGVNYAYEVSKLLQEFTNTKLVFLDRGPELQEQKKVTKRLVRKTLKAHEPLFAGFGVNEQIKAQMEVRIEQSLNRLYEYSVTGKSEFPIYSFEAKGNGVTGYMDKWEEHTEDFKEVVNLNGNHYEILSPENTNYLSNFLKTI